MKPHERIRRLFFNHIRKTLSIVGHDLFRSEVFKPYWLTYAMYGAKVLMYMGTAKTLYFYDIIDRLNVTAFVGLAFQVMLPKFKTFLK